MSTMYITRYFCEGEQTNIAVHYKEEDAYIEAIEDIIQILYDHLDGEDTTLFNIDFNYFFSEVLIRNYVKAFNYAEKNIIPKLGGFFEIKIEKFEYFARETPTHHSMVLRIKTFKENLNV